MHFVAEPEQPSEVRPRRDEDIAEAAAILVAVHQADGYPVEGVDDPEAWLKSPELIHAWVAVMAGRVVGHAGVGESCGDEAAAVWFERSGEDDSQVVVAARLFVAPEARGTGLGERLTKTVMDYARGHGVRLVFEVMTKDAAAIRLYEKLGCQEVGRITHRYGEGQQTNAVCYVWPAPDHA
ncbi:GNAT family N-acetyltransferase [Streptomyces lasiicapitis]|uniref:GNAT family N-acetyltransferase n=1 Tax=Streptomyces lasiicapitis TaxID=1923961 RepID=UPI0036A29E6D